MSAVRNVIKRLVFPVLSKWYERKNDKPQNYNHRGLDILVLPEVFHPKYFLSTDILLDFILTKDIEGKKVLELGAGSGFISFYLAKNKGALVTASDINPKAIEGLKLNSESLKVKLDIVQSNLFEKIDLSVFDFVLINPPYYPKNPDSMRYVAFYCGEDFDYFKKLFSALAFMKQETNVFMILSQDCEIEIITQLANNQNLAMHEVFRTKKKGEMNFIFNIFTHAKS